MLELKVRCASSLKSLTLHSTADDMKESWSVLPLPEAYFNPCPSSDLVDLREMRAYQFLNLRNLVGDLGVLKSSTAAHV